MMRWLEHVMELVRENSETVTAGKLMNKLSAAVALMLTEESVSPMEHIRFKLTLYPAFCTSKR
jgi:hypothetical protein